MGVGRIAQEWHISEEGGVAAFVFSGILHGLLVGVPTHVQHDRFVPELWNIVLCYTNDCGRSGLIRVSRDSILMFSRGNHTVPGHPDLLGRLSSLP